ncbi:MAG: IniB N-terminal domain-containing protein, partial [Actinomycetota bacterium]|nr:IniB N-terminal domain-containing protein [Actinomycetota bacterium]
MRDPAARAEFDRDPDGTLERNGLDGLSGHDVRDARLLLA